MAKYLDANGVKYLWSKIKDNFWSKSDLDTTFVEVVDNLPTEGIKRCLYLKATAVEGDNNKYEEYIYIGDLPISETNPYDATKWEKLGEYKAEVDLTPYAKKSEAVGSLKYETTYSGGILYYKDVNGNTINDVGIPNASSTEPGLMAASERKKLDSIEDNANNYTLPAATDTTMGGVKLYGATTVATDTTDGGYDVKTTNALIGAAPFKNTIGNTATDYNDRESTTNDATFINQPNGKGVTSSIQVKGSGTVKVSSANHVITIQDTAFTGAVGGSGTTSDGTAGYVPAPKKAQYHNYLRGDGTWASAPVTIWGTSATDAAGSGSLSGTAYLNTVIDKGTSGSVINSCAITAGNNMSIIGLTSGGITIGTTATADSALTNDEIDAAIA